LHAAVLPPLAAWPVFLLVQRWARSRGQSDAVPPGVVVLHRGAHLTLARIAAPPAFDERRPRRSPRP